MKHSTNPHRRPATQADVRKARNEGIRAAAVVCMFVLREYFGFGKSRLTRFWTEFERLALEIGRGETKLSDVEAALRDDYGIEVR